MDTRFEILLKADSKDEIDNYFNTKAVYDGTLVAFKKASEQIGITIWDDTTTANCVYIKYLDGTIKKIDITNKTIYQAASGVWANCGISLQWRCVGLD